MIDFDKLWYFGNHNHTESSNQRLLDSTNKIDKMVKYAQELGLKGIAITDHESLTQHIKAMNIGKKLKEEGSDFKVALGNEIYLVNSLEEVRDNYQGGGLTRFPHLVLVAKDKIGYEAIRTLSTQAWEDSFFAGGMRRVVTTKTNFANITMNPKYKGHLIVSSACLGGEIAMEFEKYKNGDSLAKNRILKFVQAMKICIGDDFYLEMQPSSNEEQIEYNKFLIQLSVETNCKLIFTTDTHYLDKRMQVVHGALLNSKDGDREVSHFYASTYMMSTKEVWDYFKDYIDENLFMEMCDNTIEIYNSIEYFDLFHKTIVPQIEMPPFNPECDLSRIQGYEFISKYSNSPHLIDKYLIYKLDEGMKKLGQAYGDVELSRIDIELKQLWKISENLESRVSSYYLLTQEVIDLSWESSYVCPGRGSGVAFYCNYLLQITQLNPITNKLPYWRHISEERPEMPDIDFDLAPEKREEVFEKCKDKYGRNRCLNILTVKTLTTKACIQAIGRGLGYNNDDISAISDLVPVDRGNQWSLDDCLYGNEEKERKAIPQFKNIIKQYPNLIELASEIEGLETNMSSHASAFVIFDKDYRLTNSLMVTPGGTHVTCWTMHECEEAGALKLDFLVTDGMSKLMTSMRLLIEDGILEDKGSLRANYYAYIHPDVIDYEDQGMYDLLFSGEIIDAFQYQTPLGKQVLRKLNARRFMEIKNGNSLMRLSVKHGEQPLDRYIRYKNNPGTWEREMEEYGLNDFEIVILKENLDSCYGVMDTQEAMMITCMDSRISNFTMGEANGIRKAVAKKKAKLVESSKALFYSKGLENGCRKIFLDYIWDVQITPQLGYSFSDPHVAGYSTVLMQESNIAYKFGSIYWKCGCLIVNSASETDKTTNYGKIASAVADLRDIVELPNINLSKKGFRVKGDKILYGLKPIVKVSDDDIEQIISNAPFTSFEDFRTRTNISDGATINLIKSGSFDTIEPNREKLLYDFISSISKTKSKLTSSNIKDLVEHQIIDKSEFEKELLYTNVYKFICSKSNLVDMASSYGLKGQWYKVESQYEAQFLDLYCTLEMDRDYMYSNYGLVVKKSAVEKIKKANAQKLNDILASNEVLDKLNKSIIEENMKTLAFGGRPKWEMDSMYYYYSGHELDNVDLGKFAIKNFFELPTTPPIIDSGISTKGIPWRKYDTHLVAGTVLNADKDKGYVTIQTQTGVVNVRLSKGVFNHYNKNLSIIKPDGKKKVIDSSWLKRGNIVIVQGYRNEEEFIPKHYFDSVFQHSMVKVESIDKNGEIQVKMERSRI